MAAVVLVGWLGCVMASEQAQAPGNNRFAVAHITNDTDATLTFYRRWVWNYGTPKQRVEIDWRVTRIPPGKTLHLHYQYDGKRQVSPDLIVVYDADRNKGALWEMVKLDRGASPDFRDRRTGFAYTLKYDNRRKEYASLVPRNGGKVTILDRKTRRPKNAKEVPF